MTDASGTIYGLNKIFEKFDNECLNRLCTKLGSDLNVCLNGGCVLATSRGEITKKLPDFDYEVSLIKPKNLGISAGEAYTKYSLKESKPQNDMTEKMRKTINIALIIFFLLTTLNGVRFAILDYRYSYSGGKETAQFIERNIEKEEIAIVISEKNFIAYAPDTPITTPTNPPMIDNKRDSIKN